MTFPQRHRLQFLDDVRIGQSLEPCARIVGDDSAIANGFCRERVPVAGAETESITGEQQVDDLTPALGSDGGPQRHPRNDAVPALDRIPLPMDEMPSAARGSHRERVSELRPSIFGALMLPFHHARAT